MIPLYRAREPIQVPERAWRESPRFVIAWLYLQGGRDRIGLGNPIGIHIEKLAASARNAYRPASHPSGTPQTGTRRKHVGDYWIYTASRSWDAMAGAMSEEIN